MNILGLNTCFTANHHDPSAVLLIDGRPVYAAEEERFLRIKTATSYFPAQAIKNALNFTSLSIHDIDIIAVPGLKSDLKAKINRVMNHVFGYCPTIEQHHHELCHAAGAFYSSGFTEATTLSVDGYGDNSSGCHTLFREGRPVSTTYFPLEESLGIFYGIFTEYLGFQRTEGEFKVMGMAALGQPLYNLDNLFNEYRFQYARTLLSDSPKLTSIHEPYCDYSRLNSFCPGLPPRRLPGQPFEQSHFDLASSVQFYFDQVYRHLIISSLTDDNSRNICLSGGCALNCLSNSFLLNNPLVDNFYVQPAASDRGLSLGSSYLSSIYHGIDPIPPSSMYLGNDYKNSEIKDSLEKIGISYYTSSDFIDEVSHHISSGQIVGFFQHRSEFGPRALGSRSIIADPTVSGVKNRINASIKYRESYRPFAPIISKDLALHHNLPTNLPHMTVAVFPQEDTHCIFGDTIHADFSTRLQVPDVESHPIFDLANYFCKNTGHSLLNTSFNLAGEPLVESPLDAIRTFYSSGIDLLSIGPFMISKDDL